MAVQTAKNNGRQRQKKKTHIDANMSYWQSCVLYIFKWMNYVLFALLYTRIQVYNLLANVLYTLL